jgi:hypothetical protein
MQALRRHGYKLSAGTFYPILELPLGWLLPARRGVLHFQGMNILDKNAWSITNWLPCLDQV